MNRSNIGISKHIPSHWRGEFPDHVQDMLKTWGIGDLSFITSQCGQAELIYLLTKEIVEFDMYTYLDIGSNDGITASSTFLLDQAGWHGMCVEPQAKLSIPISSRSKRTKILTAAISSRCGVIDLMTSDTLSTLATLKTNDEIYISRLRNEANNDIYSIPTPVIPSTSVYKYFIQSFGSLTFLKIDCEGSEEEAIKGLAILKNDSLPIFIEYENNYRSDDCANLLKSLGYCPLVLMDSFCEIWYSQKVNSKIIRAKTQSCLKKLLRK